MVEKDPCPPNPSPNIIKENTWMICYIWDLVSFCKKSKKIDNLVAC